MGHADFQVQEKKERRDPDRCGEVHNAVMNPPDHAPCRTAIAVIGNPGTGKSTLINGLVGSAKFQSGFSLSGSLTKRLQCHSVDNDDTPGLFSCDSEKRYAPAMELDMLFSKNFPLSIVFVVSLESGRARLDDMIAIQTVLDAISVDTTNRFGVIVNKVWPSMLSVLQKEPEAEKHLRRTMTGNHQTNHWCYVPIDPSLVCSNNGAYMTTRMNMFLRGLVKTKHLRCNFSSIAEALQKPIILRTTTHSEVLSMEIEEAHEPSFPVHDQDLEPNDGADWGGRKHRMKLCKVGKWTTMDKAVVRSAEHNRQVANVPRFLVDIWGKSKPEAPHEGKDAYYLEAVINLGVLLSTGAVGRSRAAIRAKEFYELVILGNTLDAVVNLGCLGSCNDDEYQSSEWKQYGMSKCGADSAHANAIYNLGLLLRKGDIGVPKDVPRAMVMFKLASAAGHIPAMNAQGFVLCSGDTGVPQDVPLGIEMYKQAAKGGYARAMMNLGNVYDKRDPYLQPDFASHKDTHMAKKYFQPGGSPISFLEIAASLAIQKFYCAPGRYGNCELQLQMRHNSQCNSELH